ncbi:MAG: RpiB/LacA/LacB family sugar-phosphate isomerase [Candidatus Pacebacteria bacterium]|nr:RpiB/LacA/LacB family sugar-phosphate isomerase [Candidatus Paceibacterota bacterium]
MKIFISSDHAGFELKEKLKIFLAELGHEVKDFGAFSFDENDDYPDFINPLAEEISRSPEEAKGIILGGSGQGEAICANRFKNVRAAVLHHFSEDIIKLSRRHNDANVLSLAARFLNEDEAKKAVKLWLETDFSGEERHSRRIKKIDE